MKLQTAPEELASKPVFTDQGAMDAESRAPLGATVHADGVIYCVWAPEHDRAEVEAWSASGGDRRTLVLSKDEEGYHRGTDPQGQPGDRYQIRLDGEGPYPDPASRAQAESVHAPSVVVDPTGYTWNDANWSRPPFRDLTVYELHIGTFTEEGTFRAAIEKLPYLRDLGVTAIEIMPIGDFPGVRNWGYDGVLIYAPARAYGSPDDLRALVDSAHQHGLAVLLDVVYNHLGPDGNYLGAFSRHFFHENHSTPWGKAFNFDGKRSAPVREFFGRNPVYWMEEFHLDGFRFDATHEIEDESERHILAEMTDAIHARGGYAIAEDSRNERLVLMQTRQGGLGFDGVWADDFHHCARVGQTSETDSYYQDFTGSLPELIETLRHGWLYRGQTSKSKEGPRGTDADDLSPAGFVYCISNHDQAGNRAFGERINAAIAPAAYRALSALLCLSPSTPMLFMGQEWAASTPFLYFTDHNNELGPLVTEGRRREFAGFKEFADHDALERIPDPQAPSTLTQSKLNWKELEVNPYAAVCLLYRECLRFRREFPELRPSSRDSWKALLIGPQIGLLHLSGEGNDLLLVFHLDAQKSASAATHWMPHTHFGSRRWRLLLSSQEERFGGSGPGFDPATQIFSFHRPEALLLQAE
jgi:maltooligosyltrehalose trehalohydrolase